MLQSIRQRTELQFPQIESGVINNQGQRENNQCQPSMYSNRIALMSGSGDDVFIVGRQGCSVFRLPSSNDKDDDENNMLSFMFDSHSVTDGFGPVEDLIHHGSLGNRLFLSDIYGQVVALDLSTTTASSVSSVTSIISFPSSGKQQTCSKLALFGNFLYQSDGVYRCMRQIDSSTGQLVRTLYSQNCPTDIKPMDLHNFNLNDSGNIVGIAEQHQLTVWDMRQSGRRSPVQRMENPKKSTMISLDSNGHLVVAGGCDRTLYAFDPRKLSGVAHAVPGCIKYDITSVIASYKDPDKVFVSGNADSELVCVDFMQKERSNRFTRSNNDDDVERDGDNVFRADSRWLGLARRHKIDGGEELIALSARYSLYQLALLDNHAQSVSNDDGDETQQLPPR